jgi:hypothetical protein
VQKCTKIADGGQQKQPRRIVSLKQSLFYKKAQRRTNIADLKTKSAARIKRTDAPSPLRKEASRRKSPFATFRIRGVIQRKRDHRVMTSINSVGRSVIRKILPFCLLSQTVRPRRVRAAKS